GVHFRKDRQYLAIGSHRMRALVRAALTNRIELLDRVAQAPKKSELERQRRGDREDAEPEGVRPDERRVVKMNPVEEEAIALADPLDPLTRERTDGRRELMTHHRSWFVPDVEAPFPRAVAELHVFQVERREEWIEPAEL